MTKRKVQETPEAVLLQREVVDDASNKLQRDLVTARYVGGVLPVRTAMTTLLNLQIALGHLYAHELQAENTRRPRASKPTTPATND